MTAAQPEVVRSLARRHHVEVEKVRGSRFVGHAAPCTSPEQAQAFVDDVRAGAPDASHHCWGWRLEDGRERSSDDGEPAGTAGAPILRRIGGADLADVVVVVSRWFGGTKLGTGGLVRAYGGAAAAVLADAPVETRPVVTTLDLTHPYDLQGIVDGMLAEHEALVVESTYGAEVALTVAVARDRAAAFATAVREGTSGRVDPTARA